MDYRLVVMRGRSATTTVTLGDGVTTAGRQEDCQLRIASAQVSRRHCEIFEKKGLLLVKDLGSSNGTFVNGKKIEGQRVIEHGDELAIGPVKFRVEKVAPAPAKSAEPKKSPGDTAVGADAPLAVDFDLPIPVEETADAAVESRPAAVPAGAKAASPGADTKEIGEDDVADFLMNLEVDEKDR